MNLISDLIKLKFNNNDHLINQDKIMVLQTLANRVTMTKLFSFYDLLLEICRLHEVKINMNKNLLLEKLMLNWLA
jgi:hypothetical protein